MQNLRIGRMAITVFVVLVAMLAGACADSPTAPKERITVAVSVLGLDWSTVYTTPGSVVGFGIQSIVVGRNSTRYADVLITRKDALVDSVTKAYENSYTSQEEIGNTWKPSVVRYEYLNVWVGDKVGTSWFVFKSRTDPTQKDSVRIVIQPYYGGAKG